MKYVFMCVLMLFLVGCSAEIHNETSGSNTNSVCTSGLQVFDANTENYSMNNNGNFTAKILRVSTQTQGGNWGPFRITTISAHGINSTKTFYVTENLCVGRTARILISCNNTLECNDLMNNSLIDYQNSGCICENIKVSAPYVSGNTCKCSSREITKYIEDCGNTYCIDECTAPLLRLNQSHIGKYVQFLDNNPIKVIECKS